MAKVTKDMLIGQLITLDPNIAPILMRAGMHCLGCPSSRGETIEQAAKRETAPSRKSLPNGSETSGKPLIIRNNRH